MTTLSTLVNTALSFALLILFRLSFANKKTRRIVRLLAIRRAFVF